MDSSSQPQSPRRPRRISVLRTQALGPRMRRIVFGGGDLHDFPDIGAGAHIKLFFPPADAPLLLPRLGNAGVEWPAGTRPIARTYSVRRSDAARGLVEIDFVLHAEQGPASQWARSAQAGDIIGIAGPGGPELVRGDADRYLLCGDLSALPAIAAVLERLPEQARGDALIEVDSAAEQQPLQHPRALRLHWVHRGAARADAEPLVAAALAIDWPCSQAISATVAGESRAVAAIRAHLLQQRGLDRSALYAVPYWRRGQREEDYHAERHRFMDQEA